MNRFTPVYLLNYLPGVLIVVALIVALIVAASKRDQLGTKAFGLLMSGLGLLVLAECAFGFLNAFAYYTLRDTVSASQVGTMMALMSLVGRVIWVTGLGLVIGAVFADRPHRTAEQPNAPRP